MLPQTGVHWLSSAEVGAKFRAEQLLIFPTRHFQLQIAIKQFKIENRSEKKNYRGFQYIGLVEIHQAVPTICAIKKLILILLILLIFELNLFNNSSNKTVANSLSSPQEEFQCKAHRQVQVHNTYSHNPYQTLDLLTYVLLPLTPTRHLSYSP